MVVKRQKCLIESDHLTVYKTVWISCTYANYMYMYSVVLSGSVAQVRGSPLGLFYKCRSFKEARVLINHHHSKVSSWAIHTVRVYLHPRTYIHTVRVYLHPRTYLHTVRVYLHPRTYLHTVRVYLHPRTYLHTVRVYLHPRTYPV